MSKNLDKLIIFSVFIIVYYAIINTIDTDIIVHIGHILKINKGEASYPPNFLAYWLINFFSVFSFKEINLIYSASFLLAFFTTYKYSIIKLFLVENYSRPLSKNIIIAASVSLLLILPLPDYYNIFVLKQLFVAKFNSNVWHNTTTIFVFPFAILLFKKTNDFLLKGISLKKKDTVEIIVIIILNIIIKPSFLFAFIPATFFYIILKYSINDKRFVYGMSFVAVSTVLIVLQYFLIYIFEIGNLNNSGQSDNGIVFTMPFEYFNLKAPLFYIPVALITSYAAPLILWVTNRKELKEDSLFIYTVLLVLFAILISTFLMESGPRSNDGNFTWQIILCSNILYIVTCLKGIELYKTKKNVFFIIVLGLQVLWGGSYILKNILLFLT